MAAKQTDQLLDIRAGGERKDFLWLMEQLLPPSDKIKGCELVFPDTVFFEKGKPKVLIKSDKDLCLTSVRAPTKLSKENLQKEFPTLFRERRRDTVGIFRQKYGNEISHLEKHIPQFVK
jgi:hypothetical protein